MSSPRGHTGSRSGGIGRFLALGLAFACAGMTGGCFQPLYGNVSTDTYGAAPPIRTALASVQVEEIEAPNGTPEARMGVEVRNALIFGLTGGAGQLPPNYKLKINLVGQRQNVIVDVTTARADMEIYGLDATYSLIEIGTNKVVLTGRAFARQSYDIPGQQQRFARARGERDAQNRASTIIAEQIKSRLASYFVAGG
ncbi:LPS assembly lipoprotein LptE [Pseudorhodoplanes sp.]|uniref:LPS assembly lipoprotein LptE n=1 Tax=Pseudorhodoplanes sp. TaxID=1934341 RepID=UPI002C35B77B|nr:LPS assembly lipoprotein LptE [Pseudorhodoplanes sp.]HWV53073.1 LPS assembly lipoprotein LptE [Pseudorhodoplanes sp.]